MFEPFVSHGKNNGTGLGLAIASKVVHDHGGEIRVESSSPQGTVMLIRLPRNEAVPVSETRAANVP
jgi:signal transduction histidine kinase